MKEPSVSIQMVVDTIASSAVSGQNIAGGVIIADCGTLENKVFYSSTEVLREFTKTGAITRSTDITLIHAAAIADIMPVLLRRSYKDDGVRAGFGIYKIPLPNSEVTEVSLAGLSNVTSGVEKQVYDGTEVVGTIIAEGSSVQANPDSVQCSSISLIASRDFNKVNLVPAPESGYTFDFSHYKYAYLTDAYGEENYLRPDQVTLVNPDDPYSIKVVAKLDAEVPAGTMITFVFDDSNIEYFASIDSVLEDPYDFTECYFKKGIPLGWYQDMTIESGTLNPITFVIGINGYVFYNASVAAPALQGYELIPVEGITRQSTTRDIVDAINQLLSEEYFYFDGGTNFKVFAAEELDPMPQDPSGIINTSLAVAQRCIQPQGGGFSVVLYARYPSSIDFSGRIVKSTTNSDLIDVTVVTANRTYEYTGSTDPEYVNEYGVNQWIGNINEYDGIPFQIEIMKDADGNVTPSDQVLDTDTIAFGKMSIGKSADLTSRKAALEELCDQDEIKIAFLCPFGYPHPGYLSKLVSYGPKIWAFSPIGLYVYNDDPEAIIANRPSISTEYAMLMAPHDKSTLMTDWVQDMSLEVAYLAKVTSNAAKFCEFAPMMGKDNATLSITKPSVKFKKSTREKLLDARIMSLVTRTSEGVNYLNKNQCSGGNTVLAEDQNARLACKINRDIDTLLEPILGRFNTEETRSRVTSIINNYMTNNITNQVYSIESYNVVCDESNNPANIRANNKLVVDLTVVYLNTIWEVVVYHRALDVNAAANQ